MEAEQIGIKPLFISLAAIVSIEVACRLVISPGYSSPLFVLGAVRFVQMVLMIVIVVLWGRGLSSIGLAFSEMIPGIKKGLLWSFGFGMITFVAFWVCALAGIDPRGLIRVRLPVEPGEIVLFFFIGGIMAPIAEELFFRGIVFGFLRQWGVIFALIASSFLFVLAHPIFPGIPIPQLVGGVVFALAYEMGGSLMAPITIHALGNLAIFTLSLTGL
jgi:membrane protease YdiL (CAAX protease family)